MDNVIKDKEENKNKFKKHYKKILIGVGVIAAATAGYLIYRHYKKSISEDNVSIKGIFNHFIGYSDKVDYIWNEEKQDFVATLIRDPDNAYVDELLNSGWCDDIDDWSDFSSSVTYDRPY